MSAAAEPELEEPSIALSAGPAEAPHDDVGVPDAAKYEQEDQWTDISDSEEEKGWTPAQGARDDQGKTLPYVGTIQR